MSVSDTFYSPFRLTGLLHTQEVTGSSPVAPTSFQYLTDFPGVFQGKERAKLKQRDHVSGQLKDRVTIQPGGTSNTIEKD